MPQIAQRKRQPRNEIELVDLDEITPAGYNPRETVSERLEQVVKSLKYLGFVLPLYVRDDNNLLSGHQRTMAAKLAGYTKAPVVRFNPPKNTEMGYNLMFNKGTNDYTGQTGAEAFKDFVEGNQSLLEGVDPLPPDTFPCVTEIEHVEVDLLYENIGPVDLGQKASAAQLIQSSIFMPIIARRDNTVINGVSRLYNMKHSGWKTCDVIYVDDDRAEFAHLCLNLLAMDFDLRRTFYDRLRWNAFRRRSVSTQMINASRTYTYWAFGKWVPTALRSSVMASHEGKQAKADLEAVLPDKPDVRKLYKEKFGQNIVDMGAGTFHDANLLIENGFNVMAWEPYCLSETEKGEKIDSERSRRETQRFLNQIEELTDEKGVFPDAIVSSFTLNSIPHHEDRIAFLTICHALCGLKTDFYLGTQSVRQINTRTDQFLNPNLEPNMVLGMGLSNFKVQKYFHPEEVETLLKIFWAKVDVVHRNNNVMAHCKFPKVRKANLLKEAIETEFGLPFEDGTTLDAVDRAKEVFSKFTALNLE